MTDKSTATLAYWVEHRQQLRQSENQRSVLTNYTLIIATALTGIAAQLKFGPETIPLTLILFLLGAYGALASAKYHERASYHLSQARALTNVLIELEALPESRELLENYREKHALMFPRLTRVRLYMIWNALHFAIAVLGLALTIFTALKAVL